MDRRVRLEFRDALTPVLLRSHGFASCWYLVPENVRIVGDLAYELLQEFRLQARCPRGLSLLLNGLPVLLSQDIRIVRDEDTVTVQCPLSGVGGDRIAIGSSLLQDESTDADQQYEARRLRRERKEEKRMEKEAKKLKILAAGMKSGILNSQTLEELLQKSGYQDKNGSSSTSSSDDEEGAPVISKEQKKQDRKVEKRVKIALAKGMKEKKRLEAQRVATYKPNDSDSDSDNNSSSSGESNKSAGVRKRQQKVKAPHAAKKTRKPKSTAVLDSSSPSSSSSSSSDDERVDAKTASVMRKKQQKEEKKKAEKRMKDVWAAAMQAESAKRDVSSSSSSSSSSESDESSSSSSSSSSLSDEQELAAKPPVSNRKRKRAIAKPTTSKQAKITPPDAAQDNNGDSERGTRRRRRPRRRKHNNGSSPNVPSASPAAVPSKLPTTTSCITGESPTEPAPVDGNASSAARSTGHVRFGQTNRVDHSTDSASQPQIRIHQRRTEVPFGLEKYGPANGGHYEPQEQQEAPQWTSTSAAAVEREHNEGSTRKKTQQKEMWKRPYEVVASIHDKPDQHQTELSLESLVECFPTTAAEGFSFQVSDIVAYKTLTLCMKTWQPIMSDWQCGKVTSADTNEIQVAPLRLSVSDGKLLWKPLRGSCEAAVVQASELSAVRYLEGPTHSGIK